MGPIYWQTAIEITEEYRFKYLPYYSAHSEISSSLVKHLAKAVWSGLKCLRFGIVIVEVRNKWYRSWWHCRTKSITTGQILMRPWRCDMPRPLKLHRLQTIWFIIQPDCIIENKQKYYPKDRPIIGSLIEQMFWLCI